MVKIKIDGREMEVADGMTILQAANGGKANIPSFCYHPKLSIAGNCRMCLVNIKGQSKPVISCREKVREGLEIETKTPEVKKMQQGILEFILRNHPLDCPICDQSGECDLQDHYFNYSLFPSRLEDEKIHKPKAKSLGKLVTLDDERCILCTRCVRFCDEVVGTHELCITERGGHSELTTYPDKPMNNAYSLNTVDICPVGALTSTDFRFKKRVWFLKTTETICTGCATGCNIKMDSEDSVVYRYRPRENEAVNECWMCDEGRLSYKFINDESRAFDPLVLTQGEYQKVTWDAALQKITEILQENPKVGGAVLSAQASCEENFVLYSFVKKVFSTPTFFRSKKEILNPTHDDFLIDADKNPNSAFLNLFSEKVAFANDFAANGVWFVLDRLTQEQMDRLLQSKPKLVVCLTTNLWEKVKWADVILPKPTFAEQEGTFINRQRRIQRARLSFEARPHVRSVWRILNTLSKNLEKPLAWNNPEEIFGALTQEIPALTGLDYKKMGTVGLPLP